MKKNYIYHLLAPRDAPKNSRTRHGAKSMHHCALTFPLNKFALVLNYGFSIALD